MKLVRRLQECKSISDIDRLGLRLRPTFRKTLETAILLSNHPDKTQRDYGAQFMRAVIQEAEERGEDAVTAPSSADGLKTKGDHFVKEEELDNHNASQGNAGSDQSSDNTEPYPEVADSSEDGSKDMEKMSDTENQMKEGFPPMGGMPPQNGGMPPMGMEPGVAGEMGAQMPQLPPMNTNQMMRQMQYTLNETLKKYVLPLRQALQVQRETIKKLSLQIREVEAGKGAMKLDIGKVRDNAMARTSQPIHETVTNIQDAQKVHSVVQETESARNDIIEMDKMFRSK